MLGYNYIVTTKAINFFKGIILGTIDLSQNKGLALNILIRMWISLGYLTIFLEYA